LNQTLNYQPLFTVCNLGPVYKYGPVLTTLSWC